MVIGTLDYEEITLEVLEEKKEFVNCECDGDTKKILVSPTPILERVKEILK